MIFLHKSVQGHTKLAQIADALNLVCFSFGLGNRCQQKRRQKSDDCNDNQKFHQRQSRVRSFPLKCFHSTIRPRPMKIVTPARAMLFHRASCRSASGAENSPLVCIRHLSAVAGDATLSEFPGGRVYFRRAGAMAEGDGEFHAVISGSGRLLGNPVQTSGQPSLSLDKMVVRHGFEP